MKLKKSQTMSSKMMRTFKSKMRPVEGTQMVDNVNSN